MEEPLIDKKVQLERFPGKGGWTYARLPEISPDKKSPFGWRRVKGAIDNYEFKAYHLMPMGNGELFLPVKAEIRKIIKKKEGDWIQVKLYPDDTPLDTPQELRDCLEDAPAALKFYESLTQEAQKKYLDWIYSAKSDSIKVERLAKAIQNLERGLENP